MITKRSARAKGLDMRCCRMPSETTRQNDLTPLSRSSISSAGSGLSATQCENGKLTARAERRLRRASTRPKRVSPGSLPRQMSPAGSRLARESEGRSAAAPPARRPARRACKACPGARRAAAGRSVRAVELDVSHPRDGAPRTCTRVHAPTPRTRAIRWFPAGPARRSTRA